MSPGVLAMGAVARNELRTLLFSPLGWAFLVAGLLIGGWLFQLAVVATGEASLRGWLPNFAVTLMFCVPLVTMRSIAGEVRRGTLELILSAPVPLWGVLVGKWLGVLAVSALLLGLTAPFVVLLTWIGDPDLGAVFSTYLALLLCCGLFTAVGVFASAVTTEPTVAGMVTLALLVPSWLAGVGLPYAPASARWVLAQLSVAEHLWSFARGVLDSGDVAWFVLSTGLFLFAAWRGLEARRWR